MKCKLGSSVSVLSGRLGGSFIQRSGNGFTLSRISLNRDNIVKSPVYAFHQFSRLVRQWRNLTSVERRYFSKSAIIMCSGSSVVLTGYELFIGAYCLAGHFNQYVYPYPFRFVIDPKFSSFSISISKSLLRILLTFTKPIGYDSGCLVSATKCLRYETSIVNADYFHVQAVNYNTPSPVNLYNSFCVLLKKTLIPAFYIGFKLEFYRNGNFPRRHIEYCIAQVNL